MYPPLPSYPCRSYQATPRVPHSARPSYDSAFGMPHCEGCRRGGEGPYGGHFLIAMAHAAGSVAAGLDGGRYASVPCYGIARSGVPARRGVPSRSGSIHTFAAHATRRTVHPDKLPHRPGPHTMLSKHEQRILKEVRDIHEGSFLSGPIINARIAQIAYEQSNETCKPLARIPSCRFRKRHAKALKSGNINHLTMTRALVTQAQLDGWVKQFR
jgi:hypothetical protein